jgi:hypothetical protein
MPIEHWIQDCIAARFLYDWQNLLAGVFALGAALIVVWASRLQERRQVEAMRLSLALDIRRLIDIMLQTHNFFSLATNQPPLRADAVAREILRAEPIVFPAVAGRVGLLESPLAGYVLMFHANLKQIEHQGRSAANQYGDVPPADLRALVKLIEKACRQTALPLLSELPQDKNSPDTERKTKIEAMGLTGPP